MIQTSKLTGREYEADVKRLQVEYGFAHQKPHSKRPPRDRRPLKLRPKAMLRKILTWAHKKRNMPIMLVAFRELYEQDNTEMVQLLLKYGVVGVNYSTYHRWKEGKQKPRGLSVNAVIDALERAKLDMDRAQD